MKAYILEDNGVQIGDTVWPSILDESEVKREDINDPGLNPKEKDRICVFNLEDYPEFKEVLFGSMVVRCYEGYNKTYKDAQNAYERFTNEESLGYDEGDIY